MWLKRFFLTALKTAILFTLLVVVGVASTMLTIRFLIHSEQVEVPDLIGMDATEALGVLNKLDLRTEIEQGKGEYSTTIPANRVLKQSPAPRTELKVGRKVRLSLSLGPQLAVIPDLTGKSSSEAQIRIHESGLSVGDILYAHSGRTPENVVLAQSPVASAEKVNADVVRLLVSSGPEDVRYIMPDLVSLPVDAAKRFLDGNNLKYRIEEEVYEGLGEGLVIRQKPLSGYPLRRQDIVTLWVSRKPPQDSIFVGPM
jgi:serine/threonine-protein kinase